MKDRKLPATGIIGYAKKEGKTNQVLPGTEAALNAGAEKPTKSRPKSLKAKEVSNEANDLFFAALREGATGNNLFNLIQTARQGISFNFFKQLSAESPFSLAEWSHCLHVSERTMQRYQKEAGRFPPPQSEKILAILLLLKKGKEVFGDSGHFNAWLQAPNVALSNLKPKDLVDSSFGIQLLNDELVRIEHGIFA